MKMMDTPRTPGVLREGDLVQEDARCPIAFRGDWESILSESEIELVLTESIIREFGIQWTEGPLWLNSVGRRSLVVESSQHGGHLFFTDPTNGKIYRYTPHTTTLIVWAIHAGGIDPATRQHMAEPGSNGMAAFGDKTMDDLVVICQHASHRIVQCRLGKHTPGKPLEEAPDFQILCANYDGKPFNSPNDVAIDDTDGSIFFTDPIYGLLESSRWCDEWTNNKSYLESIALSHRTGIKGVYKFHEGRVHLVSAFHRRPNGLAFSNDRTKLWVADSTVASPSWTEYPVKREVAQNSSPVIVGRALRVLTPATLGHPLGSVKGDGSDLLGHEGLSDGFKIDERDRIWTSIPNGYCIIDPTCTPPQVVCEIFLGVNASNIAFGKDGDAWLTGAFGILKLASVLKI